MVQVYDPNLSDPVKYQVKPGFNQKKYFAVWLAMGLHHPLNYVETTFLGTYKYYNPWVPAEDCSWAAQMSSVCKISFLKLHYRTPEHIRKDFLKVVEIITDFPVTNILINSAIGIWLCGLLFILLCKHLTVGFTIPFLPIFVNLLVCIASPVNGLNRYSGCVVFPIYLLILYSLVSLKKTKFN